MIKKRRPPCGVTFCSAHHYTPLPGDILITTMTTTLPLPYGDLIDFMPPSDNALNVSDPFVAQTLQFPFENSSLKPLISNNQTSNCHHELISSSRYIPIHRTTTTNSYFSILAESVLLKSIIPSPATMVGASLHSLHSGAKLPSAAGYDLPQ